MCFYEKMKFFFLCFSSLFFLPVNSFAWIYTQTSDGNFNDPAIWSHAGGAPVPASADNIILQGHILTIPDGLQPAVSSADIGGTVRLGNNSELLVNYLTGTNGQVVDLHAPPNTGRFILYLLGTSSWSGHFDNAQTRMRTGIFNLNSTNNCSFYQQLDLGGTINLMQPNALGAGNEIGLNVGTINLFANQYEGIFNSNAGTFIDLGSNQLRIDQGSLGSTISGFGGQIYKTSSNSLIITGTNTYSGGTIIEEGIVSISSDSNLGLGPITLSGGTLKTVANIISNKNISITTSGTFEVVPLTTLELDGIISGSGSLTKINDGTLLLKGENSYSGGSTVSAGVLQGNNPHSIQGDILNNSEVIFNLSSDDTYIGNMSGTGSLTKQGVGTLTLLGTNTYSGGTTISNGTVRGSTRNLQGDIQNNATLYFDQNFDGNFSDLMIGVGSLHKSGTSKLTLSNSVTQNDTFIDEGTLSVDGSLISDLTVQKGSFLSGVGLITGNVFCSGHLSCGNSIGTLNVIGNYTFLNGSDFDVELLSNSSLCDLLNVTGAVTINPGSTIDILPIQGSGSFTTNSSYTVITTTAGVTNRFSNVICNLPLLVPTIDYSDPNQVKVLLTLLSFASVISDGNAGSVAVALDDIYHPVGSDLDYVIEQLQFLNSTDLHDALDQIHPAVYKQIALVQESNMNSIISILRNNCNKSKCLKDMKRRIDLWAAPFGNFYYQRGFDYLKGGASISEAIIMGANFDISKNTLIGILTGYSGDKLKFNQHRGNAHIDSAYVGIFGSYNNNHFYLDGSLLTSYDWISAHRDIEFSNLDRRAISSHHGNQFLGYVEGGFIWNINQFDLSAFVSANYQYLYEESFNEHGANSLNLKIVDSKYDLFRNEVGLNLSRCFFFSCIKMVPKIGFSYINEHRWKGKYYKSTLNGQSPIFIVNGICPNRNLIAPSFELNFGICSRVNFNIGYHAELGHHVDDHMINFNLSYNF